LAQSEPPRVRIQASGLTEPSPAPGDKPRALAGNLRWFERAWPRPAATHNPEIESLAPKSGRAEACGPRGSCEGAARRRRLRRSTRGRLTIKKMKGEARAVTVWGSGVFG